MGSSEDLYEMEDIVKKKYMDIIKNMSRVELKKFSPGEYQKLVLSDLTKALPSTDGSRLKETAQCILNAIEREAKSLQREQLLSDDTVVVSSPWVVSPVDQRTRDAPTTDDTGNSNDTILTCIDTSLTSTPIEFAFSSKGLHIANLNVRHIVPKIDEIRILMSNKQSPHILGLCETFLRTTDPDSQVSIDGYNFYRKDRSETQEKDGGGLLFYYKQSLNVRRRSDIEVSNIETLWAEISLPNSKPFLICSAYRPPNACSTWVKSFEEELSIAQTTGLEFILMGDFNIDFSQTVYTKWMNLLQLFDLTQLVL